MAGNSSLSNQIMSPAKTVAGISGTKAGTPTIAAVLPGSLTVRGSVRSYVAAGEHWEARTR